MVYAQFEEILLRRKLLLEISKIIIFVQVVLAPFILI